MTKTTKTRQQLTLRTVRVLSVLVLGGIGIGYLGGAINAAPDGETPILYTGVRLIGLFSAVALFLDGRGQLTQASTAILDERERALRDKAYVATHQIMVLALIAFYAWSEASRFTGGWMPGRAQAVDMLAGFGIAALALPGIIMAWREKPLADLDEEY